MKKITILLVMTAFLFQSCGKESKNIASDEKAIPVQVKQVTNQQNGSFVSASGQIEAENSANVSTRMMGYVTNLAVKVGQKVSEGQLLVSINNTDLQAKKAQVESAILQAKAGFDNAKKDYDRFVALFAQQSASQKELDDMTARYEMAKAGLAGAEQMRNEVNAQFAYANIKAPFSGVVTNTFVKEGDMANPGMPLVSVEGVAKKQVTAMVSESDISSIKNGMKAQVVVKSLNKEIDAKVIEVSGSAKNTGGQYIVKLALENSDSDLLSGMFVNVQFPVKKSETQDQNGLTVPKSALIHKGQLTGIYVVANKNTAILRWIRTGKSYGNEVEVLSGLTTNETYVASANGKLYNGVKVSF
uniref:efflux RND transporter periplasmic adaptor subunit n=1 Tax=Flavobacterium sp. TaxID=239 RepID=UPI00404B011D